MTDPGQDICTECGAAAQVAAMQPWKIPHLKSCHAVWHYSGRVRDSLVRFKFWGRRNYARTYGRKIAEKIRESKVQYDVITWVPISAFRNYRRGYDQVELIAKSVCRNLNTEPAALLHKKRHNRKQSSIKGFEKRKQNVKDVYRLLPGMDVKGKRILLLEDIITTGATISEAASVLKAHGAKEVHGFCVAVANRYHL